MITMIREDIKIINGGACGVLSLGNLFSIFYRVGNTRAPFGLFVICTVHTTYGTDTIRPFYRGIPRRGDYEYIAW